MKSYKGRAFKTTILIHALAPKKSWMALYDFLFNFYKNNLCWRYRPDDPLLDSMIEALKRKFNRVNNEEDTALQIRLNTYRFQEGIVKLVLLRPYFARYLFDHMLGKIDALVTMKDHLTETYEDMLADKWFQCKILSVRAAGSLRKRIPEIAFAEYARVRVRISCDNDIIYDSGSTLFHEMFIFAGEREIKKVAVRRGCYTFVLPESEALFCEKARVKEVSNFRISGFRAYFADLQAGSILRAGKSTIACDKEEVFV